MNTKSYLNAIAQNATKRFVKRGQVYWCHFGLNVGSEMSKATPRPAVVVSNFKTKNKVKVVSLGYNQEEFLNEVKGLEDEKEGGSRCLKCYRLRIKKSANYAKENNFDYFTTTLTISPLKNSKILNEIGASLEQEFGIKYLYSDFKKKEGYKRSIVLSREYNLYRQDYCGCSFSKRKNIND